MSQRERARVGSVAAIAINHIKERSAEGALPRQDFFMSEGEQQSTGEQLLEGVLLKARDEYERKKLPYIALFYANLVFAPAISPPVAFMLLKTLERLTYQQIILLAVIHQRGILNVSFLRAQEHQDPQIEALKREEMDLHGSDLGSLGLVGGVGPYDDHLSKLGLLLVELAGLDAVPETDQVDLLHLMMPTIEARDADFLGSMKPRQ